jgi:hypothetical protein
MPPIVTARAPCIGERQSIHFDQQQLEGHPCCLAGVVKKDGLECLGVPSVKIGSGEAGNSGTPRIEFPCIYAWKVVSLGSLNLCLIQSLTASLQNKIKYITNLSVWLFSFILCFHRGLFNLNCFCFFLYLSSMFWKINQTLCVLIPSSELRKL